MLPAGSLLLGGCAAVGPLGLGGGSAPKPDDVAEARAQAVLEPSEPYWHHRMAELQVAADSLVRAEAALHAALSRDPLYAPSLALLSKLMYDGTRHVEAIGLLEAARKRSAEYPEGFPEALTAGLALHYDAIGRSAEADALLEELGRPNVARVGPAVVYLRLRAADDAAELARETVYGDARSAANQNNWGIVRLKAGDPTGARKAFLAAIERDPTMPGPYYNLALLEKYWMLDDAAAAKWFTEYRRRSQDDPDGLAEALAKSGPSLAGPARPGSKP
jgi:tetratricopeptide (TPR) repeat protein